MVSRAGGSVSEEICWSCTNPGGEMLHFGGIHIHNKPECRHTAGIPDDEPKHDGWLNKQKDYNIDYGESWDKGILIADYSDHYGETRYLRMPAKEALSLLAWLKQEESTLQKLVEEEKKQS